MKTHWNRKGLAALAIVGALLGAMIQPTTVRAGGRETGCGEKMAAVCDYLKSQNSTGFLVILDGRVLTRQNWPVPSGDKEFPNFVYGEAEDGSLLEDVASQQKSFVSVLAAIAIDKGLLDVNRPVSDYLGTGWSKAPPDAEFAIRVIDVLTMSSGLDEKFGYQYAAGTAFFYNTPVYAIIQRILMAAAKEPLEAITRTWLTEPAGMTATAWRKRPAIFANVGNPIGLVTTPQDIGTFGLMILNDGIAANGKRIVSHANLAAMFVPSSANPSYGRLWWLNGGAFTIRAASKRVEGPLIPAAPADLVAAFGALTRRLYIVPSQKLVVVRTGAAAPDPEFDQQLWLRLAQALDIKANKSAPQQK